MPVSVMKFVTIKASATEYRLICFAFGGTEEFFAEKGYGTPIGYVAGVVLGPNPSLLLDTKFGAGYYAVERAGYVGGDDLAKAWEHILRHFDDLPERCVMSVERSAGTWTVKGVESV